MTVTEGVRFGSLVVLRVFHATADRTRWWCACDCGRRTTVTERRLSAGKISSCGCQTGDEGRLSARKHGFSHEAEYQIWKDMLWRCQSGNQHTDRWYSEVRVCDTWRNSYRQFVADMGRRPSLKHSLDRINSAGDYEPGNCRWADHNTQTRNTRNHCTNKTGTRGVSWSIEKRKWRAAIYVNNKQKHVGYFATLEEAASARRLAEVKYWRPEDIPCSHAPDYALREALKNS